MFLDASWKAIDRPGYLGKNRDKKVNELNYKYGENNWTFAWKYFNKYYTFYPACRYLYERSYFEYFMKNPEELDFVCSFDEVIDNGEANIESGTDYRRQEQRATHIQDIAIRNVLDLVGREFYDSETNNILVVRGEKTNGFKYNPGNIPFFVPAQIIQPSNRPDWAQAGSVEDFWQSNKYLMVKEG